MKPMECRLCEVVVVLGLVAVILGRAACVAALDDCGGIADRIRHGGVLWTEHAVVVQGTAAPNLSNPNLPLSVIKRTTQDAAALDAYRKAAGILTGVRISSESIAADNPRVVSRIQAFVQKAKICRAKYYADGGIDMVVMVPLSGAFAVEGLSAAGTRVAAGPSAYTGLVVDAAHLGFAPAIAPRFLDPAGNVLFDVSMVRKEVVLGGGAVRFAAAGRPLPEDWAGPRPLHVYAAGLGGASPSDLVLDKEAARALAGTPAFLGDGRVAVVIRPVAELDCRGLFDGVADHHIDWRRKLVVARGRGRVDFSKDEDVGVHMRKMERAAEVDAQRKLLEAYLAVQVDGQRSVKALPGAAKKASGLILNAVRCDAHYFKDGSAEVVMAAPLDALAALSLDLGSARPAASTPVEAPSGIIVDAVGLGFQPVLAPRLRSVDGQELYGPSQIAKAYFQQYGVVGYQPDLAEAAQDVRIGLRPAVLKASGIGPPGVLFMDPNGSRVLAQAAGASTLLSRGRVIIVSEKVRAPAPSAKRPAASTAGRSSLARPATPAGQGPKVRVGKINIP